MNEILIFLVIFASAGLIARLGHATLFSRFLIVPTFGTLGILLSDSGLGLIRQPTLLSLDLFTQVAITFLAFMLGLRRLTYSSAKASKISFRVVPLLTTVLITFSFILITMYFVPLATFKSQNGVAFYFLALFISSLLVGRTAIFVGRVRINSFHASIFSSFFAVLFLFTFYQQQFVNTFASILPLLVAFITAIICALLQRLIFISDKNGIEVFVLIAIALCALISGVAILFLVPHFLLAFLFGILISFFLNYLPYLRPLFLSEQPVRIVLMILLGAHLEIFLEPILAGLVLGATIYLGRLVFYLLLRRFSSYRTYFSAFMGSSEVCAVFLASVFFVFPEKRVFLNDLLLFVLVAASVGDILGVTRWSIILRMRKVTKNAFSV